MVLLLVGFPDLLAFSSVHDEYLGSFNPSCCLTLLQEFVKECS